MIHNISRNLLRGLLVLLLLFSAPYLAAQTPLQIDKTINQPDCNTSGSLGAASVVVSGGLLPYDYEWHDNLGTVFSTSTSVTDLAPGFYSVKVTDANSDYVTDSIHITNDIIGYVYPASPADCPLENGS